jgi:hypothetical protein
MKGPQNDYVFKMMEELVTIPKHDWTWWKTNATKAFITAFNNHLEGRMKEASTEMRFF